METEGWMDGGVKAKQLVYATPATAATTVHLLFSLLWRGEKGGTFIPWA
jgi:hypothetical protein